MSTDSRSTESSLSQRLRTLRTDVSNNPVIYRSLKRIQVLKANLAMRGTAKNDAFAGADREAFRYYLTAFLRFKNEGRFLAEWICYHLIVGVEHFYLYNNNSDDNFREVLEPFIAAGIVTLTDWPTKPASPTADLHCQQHCRHETRWLACFDADEFLLPVTAGSIPEILRSYEKYPALTGNWRYFGSAGHEKRPDGLVIENYKRCQDRLNRHVKCIIDPRRAIAYGNSHYWIYKGWQQAVDENKQEILGSFHSAPTGNLFRVNHYYTKSAEDYLAKCNPEWWVDTSGRAFPSHLKDKVDDALTQHNEAEDTTILRFASETRAKMAEFGFSS